MSGDEQTKSPLFKPETLSADEVARYLRRNPDFLLSRPDVCEAILPELDGGPGVVDLRAALLDRARDANDQLRVEIAQLADTTRSLQAEQERILLASRALLSADSFEALVGKVSQELPPLLQVERVSLAVEQRDEMRCAKRQPTRLRGLVQLAPGAVDHLLGSETDIAVAGCERGCEAVFGAASGVIRSEALMRLTVSAHTPPALLGLGARDAQRFLLGRATETAGRALLLFLAATLGELVRTWLVLPR
ncbi:MAG: DUF484 family protein [Rhodospirillales bacterium]